MKQPDYRHIILFIIFGVTILIGVVRFIRYPSSHNAVIIVNKKTVSLEEFNDRFKNTSYPNDKNDLIHSMVLKELLVQEALNHGIQNRKDFIKGVKEHFEQALAQAMVDQKYRAIEVNVEDEKIDRYIELDNKILHLTVLNYKDLEAVKQGLHDSEEKMSLPFDKLSQDVKFELLNIVKGQCSSPSCSQSDGCSVFRLDSIQPAPLTKKNLTDRDAIRRIIAEQKKERLMAEWLEKLKSQAFISLQNHSKNDVQNKTEP